MNNIFIIYLLIIFFVLFAGTKFSYYLKLLDIPNKRKIHSKPTVYTGGLLVAIIYLIFTIFIYDLFIIYKKFNDNLVIKINSFSLFYLI